MNTNNPRKGRGAHVDPPNRFGQLFSVADFEHWETAEETHAALQRTPTVFLEDSSQSILSENDSPDIPFRYSLNPYRGCEHGCSYCYARPTHEYLGLNAGLDFESRIFYKPDAAKLFRDALSKSSWKPETITMSGVTDCYQPAERKFRLSRACLEVAAEARQPMVIITKNALICRDADILAEMVQGNHIGVAVSITTLDSQLARDLEPRTSSPEARLRTVAALSQLGIPVRVMIAPVIPGLNDSEIPEILKAAKEAGARNAGYQMLRLPGAVQPVFRNWLTELRPLQQSKIEQLIQGMRGGKFNETEFGKRMRGEGLRAEQIAQTFRLFVRKFELDQKAPPLDTTKFRPPRNSRGQKTLF